MFLRRVRLKTQKRNQNNAAKVSAHSTSLPCAHEKKYASDYTNSEGMDMATGIVKWFEVEKGFGFIKPDDGGRDLFVHFSEIQGDARHKTLFSYQRVIFQVTPGEKGLMATNVRITV